MKTRIALLVLLSAGLLVATPGSALPEARTITFAVGGAPSELDFWERLLREFEAGPPWDSSGSRGRAPWTGGK